MQIPALRASSSLLSQAANQKFSSITDGSRATKWKTAPSWRLSLQISSHVGVDSLRIRGKETGGL